MQIILPLLACVISKKVFEKDRFYLLFQMLGFIKWETSIYMESFTSGKYLKTILSKSFIFWMRQLWSREEKEQSQGHTATSIRASSPQIQVKVLCD